MAKDLFYLPTYKNVATLFEKIGSAKAPEAFTMRYLADTIGLKSTGDRALINMLKKLGFIDASGRPTEKYFLLKNKETAGLAIAEGLRSAYAPLFEANETANDLNSEQLKGLISQVTGTDQKGAASIAYTFNAIAKNADFSGNPTIPKGTQESEEADVKVEEIPGSRKIPGGDIRGSLRTDFHFNIQVHLPANGTEDTYLNIFNALRRGFS